MFWTLGSLIGRGSLSICTNFNISGRTSSWCWLLVLGVGIAVSTETFLELNCHTLSGCTKWGWSNKTWFMLFVCLVVCLFVCLFEPDIYSVMADNYFSCNILCAESCLPCNRKCTYTCKHSRCSRLCGQPCTPCKVRVSTWFMCTLYDLFVCHIEGRTQGGCVQEWDVEEGVVISDWGVNRRLEETVWWEASWIYVIFVCSAMLFIDINCCRSESLFTQLL